VDDDEGDAGDDEVEDDREPGAVVAPDVAAEGEPGALAPGIAVAGMPLLGEGAGDPDGLSGLELVLDPRL
jgi:hypothetical protein